MGYLPSNYAADTLKVYLGRVNNFAAMSSGSAAVNAAGLGFASSDIGNPVMVFGAGPGGSPLITTVSAVSGANAATLAANASTSVTGKTVIHT